MTTSAASSAAYQQQQQQQQSDFFRGASTRTGRRGRGDDVKCNLEIDFNTAVFGGQKSVMIRRLEICGTCSGYGKITKDENETNCPDCVGRGLNSKTTTVKVTIPAGVSEGTKIVVPAEGDAGPRGGPPGDLFVFLKIKQFGGKGNNPKSGDGPEIKTEPIPGGDVRIDVEVDDEVAASGGNETVLIQHSVLCTECNGTGIIQGKDSKEHCPMCAGQGSRLTVKKMNVEIPPKSKHGDEICLEGEGDAGFLGGKPGNVYIRLKKKGGRRADFIRNEVKRGVWDDSYYYKSEPQGMSNPVSENSARMNEEREFDRIGQGFRQPVDPYSEWTKFDDDYEFDMSPMPGNNVRVDIHIDEKKAASGGNETVLVEHSVLCNSCNGTGFVKRQGMKKHCDMCAGQGLRLETKEINVEIPPDSKNGDELCIKNEGDAGPFGGDPGDLYIHMKVKADQNSIFGRRWDDYKSVSEVPFNPAPNSNFGQEAEFEQIYEQPPGSVAGYGGWNEFEDDDYGSQMLPVPGNDVRVDIYIDGKIATSGGKQKVLVERSVVCNACQGTGFHPGGGPCLVCAGQGLKLETKEIELQIPPNTKNEDEICIENEGDMGAFGGKPGNLYVHMKVKIDPKDELQKLIESSDNIESSTDLSLEIGAASVVSTNLTNVNKESQTKIESNPGYGLDTITQNDNNLIGNLVPLPDPVPGNDMRVDIFIDESIATYGGEESVLVEYSVPCSACKGTGFVGNDFCVMCGGQGLISDVKQVRVKIPPGSVNGEKIRLKGEGDSGPHGGQPGDLYIYLKFKNNDNLMNSRNEEERWKDQNVGYELSDGSVTTGEGIVDGAWDGFGFSYDEPSGPGMGMDMNEEIEFGIDRMNNFVPEFNQQSNPVQDDFMEGDEVWDGFGFIPRSMSDSPGDNGLDQFEVGVGLITTPSPGTDVNMDLEIDNEVAFSGGRQSLLIQHSVTCTDCGGTGYVEESQGRKPCEKCGGQGVKSEVKEIQITIPPGLPPGNKLSIKGEGDAGPRGGKPGDLNIHLKIKPDDDISQEGFNGGYSNPWQSFLNNPLPLSHYF